MIFSEKSATFRDHALVAQHSFGLEQATHGFGRVLNKGRISRRCFERRRCMLPVDVRFAFTSELGADESRGFPNRLQLDAHSIPIVGHDLEGQRPGVVQ